MNEDLREKREGGRREGEEEERGRKEVIRLCFFVSVVLSSHLCDAVGEFPSSSL